MGVYFRFWASGFSGSTACAFVCVCVSECVNVCGSLWRGCELSQPGSCHCLAPQARTVFLHAIERRGCTVVGQQWPKAPRLNKPTGTWVSAWRTGWSRRETACWRASTAAMRGSPSTSATPKRRRRRRWGPGWDGEERLVKPGEHLLYGSGRCCLHWRSVFFYLGVGE